MPMTPHKGESQADFFDRCIPEMMDNNPGWLNDQAVAACGSMFRRDKGAPAAVIHKIHAAETKGMDFVLSDATPDRFGDIVAVEGWNLANFKRNPVALFSHDKSFPIGKWENVRVDGTALRGSLRLAPEGTSPRIDEIRRLIEADILRAVSVGFLPLESKFRDEKDPWGGNIYTKSELVETSLVAIPANPNALAVARSLGISDDTMRAVFAKHGTEDSPIVSRSNGEHAKRTITGKTGKMSIAERIVDAQSRITKFKDALSEHLKTIDDENPDEASLALTEDLTEKVEVQEKALDALKRAEVRLAQSSEPPVETKAASRGELVISNQRPFAFPAKKVAPVDHIWRSATCLFLHHIEQHKRPIVEIMKQHYGEDDATLVMMDALGIVNRAATVPATTTTTNWASQLVTTAQAEFLQALTPASIYGALASKGATFTFGRSGIVSIPSRASTPTLAGGFVLQGAPIPVKQAAFAAISLTPKKCAVITTMTREIAEHSTPAIEGILRQAIIDDTAAAIDTVLLDNAAATATRPAGLKNGVSTTTVTAGGGIAALIGDMKALAGALITSTNGNLRSPVWLMSPGDVLAAELTQAAAGGDLPFRDELSRGTLLGFPVIQSTSMTADTMFLVDAADFVTATGDTPQFSVSDQAVLHMEDTTPLDITTAAVGTTVKSLWQTDSIGIRMIMDLNWAMRRTGCVAWTSVMTWKMMKETAASGLDGAAAQS